MCNQLSQRDYFAGQALLGLINDASLLSLVPFIKQGVEIENATDQKIAERAWALADAMLAVDKENHTL